MPLCPWHSNGVTGKPRGEHRAEKLGHAILYMSGSGLASICHPPPDSDEAELRSYMRVREDFEESHCRAMAAELNTTLNRQ